MLPQPLRRISPLALLLVAAGSASAQETEGGHRHGRVFDDERFYTSRSGAFRLPLPEEEDAFFFAVFGDRTGGPPEGVEILAQAVDDVNLVEPDLVMTVGDLINGYNQTPEWMVQMREFKGIMDRLVCPWFPVAGNHDVYWRGPDRPEGEHDANYEAHFGPLWYAFRHKTAWFVVLYSDEGNPETGEKTFSKPESQRMSPEQFAFLDETLVKAKDAEHVFVFLHHPRWLQGGYGDDWDRVHDRLAKAGNVSAVFAGHIHRMRYDGIRDGIEYFTLATVGGGQGGSVPEAGYLHHYNLVTVREEGIAVASFPVGAAFDPRKITGEISEEARRVATSLAPRYREAAAVESDQGVDGVFELVLTNPVSRPLEITALATSADSSWVLRPDHQHVRVEPGAAATLRLRAVRPAGRLDASFRMPKLVLDTDYLGEGLRVSIPDRTFTLPVDPRGITAPAAPETESALALDGARDHIRIEHAELDLPDGSMTVECWARADRWRDRQGLLNKTESSEFGIFVSGGTPQFTVHLDGRYSGATATERLETGRWYHLAGVWDGTEVVLFVDGKRVAAVPASGRRTIRDLPFLIGADVDGNGNANSHFDGSIDEVRISRGARYSADFTPERRLDADEHTALLLHMDGLVGPWLYDSSPAKIHPVLQGAPRLER